jgi:hypothetical protein
MRIKFEFQGGYGGLFATKPLACEVDVEQLPEDTRSKLLDLIRDAGVIEAAEQGGAPKAGRARDAYAYRLEIEDRGSQRSMAFDDASAPPEMRPLLQFLQELALERRRSGN